MGIHPDSGGISNNDTITGTYDDQDRMLSYGEAEYLYGKRGDLKRKIEGLDTTKYHYDNLGNLRSVILPNGTMIEYLIDGQNRRIAKLSNGAIVKRWLYASGLLPIAELDSINQIKIQYGPGYIAKNNIKYRVLTDHLGSLRMIVNSATGEIVQRIDYDEYGKVIFLENPDEFTDITFAGGLYDEDTKLIHFGARDYDPQIGRWTSKDPILFTGGSSNLYEYCINNPINKTDKYGLQAIPHHNPIADEWLKDYLGFWLGFEPFIRNWFLLKGYEVMTDPENRITNYDKFFHCLANCQATKMGEGGEYTAKLLSELREIIDEHILEKSKEDCGEDREANEEGRKAGTKDRPCAESCLQYLLVINK